jgi:hypothetical protein
VLFWDVPGGNGVTAGGVFYLSPRDSPLSRVTPTGSGFGWWHTDARGGCLVGTYAWWQCCVFRCWTGHGHILLGSTLAAPGWGSPLTVIYDRKFPLLVHARA